MIRFAPLLGLAFAGCVCQPEQPCAVSKKILDGGTHWFRLPVGLSDGAIELENLEDRNGLLVPRAAGPVSFVVAGECLENTWTALTTDAPFRFSASVLQFPLIRPGTSVALPLSLNNLTDDSIAVEMEVPEGFRTDVSSLIFLEPRATREFFVFFEPTQPGTVLGRIEGVAFSEANHGVGLVGTAGGPIVNVPHFVDAGVVAAMPPQQRPDGRWVSIRNDAPTGESGAVEQLPPTGSSNCPGLQVAVEEPGLLQPGASTRVLLLLPSSPIGSFDCGVSLNASPQTVSFGVSWQTLDLPACDIIDWPVSAVQSDAGFASVRLGTGLTGCQISYPHLEPADAGGVLTRWNVVELAPQSSVLIDIFVHSPADLVLNVSDPALRTLRVTVLP